MRMAAMALLVSAAAMLGACHEHEPRAQLHALFEEEWAFRLAEDPLFATTTGNHECDDLLPAVSSADQARRVAFWRGLLQRLARIETTRLARQDRISCKVFATMLRDQIADFEIHAHLMPLTSDEGFHIAFAQLPQLARFAVEKDYDNYLARLRHFPEYVQQHIALLREGLATGMVLPRAMFTGFEVTVKTHMVSDPAQSVFHAPFAAFPPAVPVEAHERLRREARTAIMEGVVAGYRQFHEFMMQEYLPRARPEIGASALPNGSAYYQQCMKRFTTLALEVEEVHRLGMEEVQRIRAEMEAVIRSTGFKGDFAAFLRFLRTSPQFYATSPDQLLKEASYIAKRMDGKLPALFKRLPRLPYGIAPVPAHLAPTYTGGRYIEPPAGGTQPGYYWVNTYDLRSRPLYVLEALTFHEAVPGHHLQIALAQELENVPAFRRFLYLPAFGEGWALYAERLGLEAGFYTDPYCNFGRLTYEMWRACRLVVDTGIHAKGWTRQQAMDFLAANTALALHEVQTETDRYISWPGQALAYKIGELKIRELRRRAETALGQKFDVREFHEVILRNGALPLPVLEEEVQLHLAARRS